MQFRRLRFCLLTFLIAAVSWSARAQDLHFSLVDFVPMWQNPALTGAYSGTARVGALYRDQWGAVLGKSYQTPAFYVDAPIVMLGEKAWLGVGASAIADRAGLASLSTTSLQGAVSYHRILNENTRSGERTVLSFGAIGGVLQRSANLTSTDIILSEEQDAAVGGGGLGVGAGRDRLSDLNSTGIDIGFGVSLARTIDEDRNFRVGASARHLSSPDYGLVDTANAQRPTTFGVQAAYRQALGTELLIEPAAYLQTTRGGGLATQVQAMVGMRMGEDSDQILRAGLGVRLPTRFVYPMIGYERGDFKAAASFDISANGLQQAEGFASGFELAVQYIIKIYKQPKVTPVLLCPQI